MRMGMREIQSDELEGESVEILDIDLVFLEQNENGSIWQVRILLECTDRQDIVDLINAQDENVPNVCELSWHPDPGDKLRLNLKIAFESPAQVDIILYLS